MPVVNLQAGQIIADKYRIVRQIGQGGMGCVYEGENIRIHRRVALKTLHASVAGKGDVLQRFEREAQAAGRIGSDHICEVLDMGDLPDGSRFMVMEFLEGTTLGDRIVRSGRITPRDLVSVLSQILEGLNAAHQAGIIHRDLKPANVFLMQSRAGRPDYVKILDFGVSKFNVLSSDEMSMTRTGAVMGTPYYMSPEQAKGARAIDTRSDLYSVGVIIYEAVTGQVPFNAETFNELIFKIALESPPPPEQFVPNLDPAFGVVMRRAMARDPAERFQTAFELKDAVLAWARDFDARGGVSGPAQQPQASTQFLPIVGAMQSRGSSPHLLPPPAAGRPAPTVIGGATSHHAQTPYAHAAAHTAGAKGGRHRSAAGIVIALAAVMLGGSLAAYFVYGRSTASAGPTEADRTANKADPAPASALASTVAASGQPSSEASSTATPSAASSPAVAAPDLVLSDKPSATPTPSTMTTNVPRPWVRPTSIVPTVIRTSTPPPPPPSTGGGRDIRPDL